MSRPWAELVFSAANALGWAAGSACLAAAGCCFYARRNSSALGILDRSADRLSRADDFPLVLAVAACGSAAAIKLAAWSLFQQTYDSTVSLQLAWNFAHGRGVEGSVFAPTLLAYHFSFLSPLISPLLRVWESPGAFALAHGLAVGAIVPGIYLLARRYSPRSYVPVLAALLAFSHPLYQSLTQTLIEDSVFAPALFIWCVYFWTSGRRTPAVVLGLLFLAAKEEAPLVFVGLGIYGVVQNRRDWKPAALIAAAVLVWFAQMRVIYSFRGPEIGDGCTNVWTNFSSFGNSSATVLAGMLRRPWDVVLQAVWPLERWRTFLRAMSYAGFVPLLAPRAGADRPAGQSLGRRLSRAAAGLQDLHQRLAHETAELRVRIGPVHARRRPVLRLLGRDLRSFDGPPPLRLPGKERLRDGVPRQGPRSIEAAGGAVVRPGGRNGGHSLTAPAIS